MLDSSVTVRIESIPMCETDVTALSRSANISQDGVFRAYLDKLAARWSVRTIAEIYEARLLTFVVKMEQTMTRQQGPIAAGAPRITTAMWVEMARTMRFHFPVDDAVVDEQSQRLRGDQWGTQGL